MGVHRSDLFVQMNDTQRKAVEAHVEERTEAAMKTNPGLIRPHELESFKLSMYNNVTGKNETGYSGDGKHLMANDSASIHRVTEITAEYKKRAGIATDAADSRELMEIERVAITARAARIVDALEGPSATADAKAAHVRKERERITGIAEADGTPLRVHKDNDALVKAITKEHIEAELQKKRQQVEPDTHIRPQPDLPAPMPTQPRDLGREA